MMDKPLKNKSRIFHYLILVGLYQLIYTRIPAHAAVAETVNAVKLLKGSSLRGLINGVLRNFQRSAALYLDPRQTLVRTGRLLGQAARNGSL